MRSEREKMLTGESYRAMDPELIADRQRARRLCHELNRAHPDGQAHQIEILRALFGATGEPVIIQPPFYCDYGKNIYIGNMVFFNFNCVILDCAEVHIGNNVFIGPAAQIYTAEHALDAGLRATGASHARPVEIGDDVWIGGGAIICPGVKIGARSVIGAGSVVTRDVPEDVIVAGNPARVIRQLSESGSAG